MGEPLRLSPTMRSRKLQALTFVKRYFAIWGKSPTLSEIAAALGVSIKRAHELVEQLSDEEQLRRIRGKRRGIELIDRGEEFSEADALLRLRALGWAIDEEVQRVGKTQPPLARPLTEKGLPDLPYLA